MWLTNLADVARSAGLAVIEQPGWRTRGHGPQTDVDTIVCHHTAGPATGNAPSLDVVQNGRSDLAGPLSHFVLARDGLVYVVAAGLCYHAGAVKLTTYSNAHAIGIEAEGTGTASWPEVQMVAYAKLCKALMRAFGLSISDVLGHKEVCSPVGRKSDPNFDMSAFRTRVATSTLGDEDMPLSDADKDWLVHNIGWAFQNPAAGDTGDMHSVLTGVADQVAGLPKAANVWAYKGATDTVDMHAQIAQVLTGQASLSAAVAAVRTAVAAGGTTDPTAVATALAPLLAPLVHSGVTPDQIGAAVTTALHNASGTVTF